MPPNTTIYDGGSTDVNNKMNSVGDTQVTNSNENVKSTSCCKKFTDIIIGTLENWFASFGYMVASNPYKTIIISLTLSVLCLAGIVEMYSENRGEELWVASDSLSLVHQDWVKERYPPQSRIINVIVDAEANLLTPAGLEKMIMIDKKVKSIYENDTTGLAWNDICYKKGQACFPITVLSIWRSDYVLIKSLNQAQILADLNNPIKTGALNLNLLLGDRSYDNNGNLTQAKAAKFSYFLKNQQVFVKSEGKLVDEPGETWEKEFAKAIPTDVVSAAITYTYAITNFREDGGSTISGDLKFLFVGYILIIAYLAIMLGSFSRINHKVWLAFAGVLCIGLSIGISYGLSSAFQLFVSPVHSILPFLLLGIGVDDIFVIVQNWDNIGGPDDREKNVADNIAKTMRKAGVSILVTSFTDICAFLIGATTVLPALRSFCIFAGIGIIGIFLLTCTLFVALLTLDNKRQRKHRDACCCCITLSDSWSPMECSRKAYLQNFMRDTYAKYILSTPGRIVVLVVTVGLLAGGAYGLTELKQDFDPDWFLPTDSPTVRFNTANKKYFSGEGIRSAAFVGQIDYFTDQKKLDDVFNALNKNPYIVSGGNSVKSWYRAFIQEWIPTGNYSSKLDSEGRPSTNANFYELLNGFFNSSMGVVYINELNRMDNSERTIKASRMEFTHTSFEDASAEITAMDSVQEDLLKIPFTNGETAFAYARFYIGWETNKVISEELIRNLILAGVIVFLVTLFLIANLWVSLMVVTCVVFTLINIAGYMHFWGLTVDTVTTIQLILAIGLSVDYSAHIGHGFMASRRGNRVERAADCLTEIGPAVVHGGMSTFLAFVFLAGSESYVFSTFFKLFFLVVVFGLFHGLVYLPVLMSLVGPKPYSSSEEDESDVKQIEPTKELNNGDTFVMVQDPNHKQQQSPALENQSYQPDQ